MANGELRCPAMGVVVQVPSGLKRYSTAWPLKEATVVDGGGIGSVGFKGLVIVNQIPHAAQHILELGHGERIARQGRLVWPMRKRSHSRAAARPSLMAHTTSDCPRRMSPAANTPGWLVAKLP